MIFASFNLIQKISQPSVVWFLSLNDLHFAIILFCISLFMAIIVSLLTQDQFSAKLREYMLPKKEVAKIFNWRGIFTTGESTDQKALLFSFILFIILVGFWGVFF